MLNSFQNDSPPPPAKINSHRQEEALNDQIP